MTNIDRIYFIENLLKDKEANMLDDWTIEEYEEELRLLKAQINETTEEITIERTKEDTTITHKKTIKVKDDELMVPTKEEVRNNRIIETGRARQRNRNDVYTNLIISCYIGKVDTDSIEDKTKEYTIYLYEKDIDERLKELKTLGWKVPSKTRLTKDLKLLHEQLGIEYVNIVNTANGVAYRIAQSHNRVYFTIVPLYKLKELTQCTNKDMIRLFICISMNKNIDTENYVSMSREYLCKCMALEPTKSNKDMISRMTTALMKLGLIDIEVETLKYFEDGKLIPSDRNYFRLTTYEEYRAKGKKRRRRRDSES